MNVEMVRMCVCLDSQMLYSGDQIIILTCKTRTLSGNEDVLVCPHNFVPPGLYFLTVVGV